MLRAIRFRQILTEVKNSIILSVTKIKILREKNEKLVVVLI